MRRIFSLPCVAQMLDAASAWRLALTCRDAAPCWKEIELRTKCPIPKALCAGLSAKRRWCVPSALQLLQDADSTPFRTKANLLRYFFRYALTPQQLYDVGRAANHIATMRLALRLHRRSRRCD